MKRFLAYLYYVIVHKFYVFKAGKMLGLSTCQLLLHDLSKFRPDEWGPYSRTFYDENGKSKFFEDPQFKLAWFHHKHRNLHHWQYWLIGNGAYPHIMPLNYVKEMVADWAGAGKAKTGNWDLWKWAQENTPMMEFHPDTETEVWKQINILRARLT